MSNSFEMLSKKIIYSTIEYPIQFSQSLNCCFNFLPGKEQEYNLSNINNYPIYPIVHLPHISQSLLMIKNKDKNEILMHYNINNKFPLNILPFNGSFFPNLINNMNFISIIIGFSGYIFF